MGRNVLYCCCCFSSSPDVDKPTMTVEPALVLEGMNIIVKCLVEGYPSLSYKWFFNGITIHGGDKVWLSVKNVTRLDTGGYSCKVENTFDKKKSDDFQININCKWFLVSFAILILTDLGTVDKLWLILTDFIQSLNNII